MENTPKLVTFGMMVKEISIKAIASGYSHSLFLTDLGKVFATGSNSDGQLGLGKGIDSCNKPRELHTLEEVK